MKIGWLSDSHLGCLQYGLERRRSDFFIGLDNAIRDMVDNHQISVIIHSGDLIDSNRPHPQVLKDLVGLNEFLQRKLVTVYVVSGNHDRTDPHWLTVLNNKNTYGFQLLDYRTVDHLDNELKNGTKVTICGTPYMPPEVFRQHRFPKADILVCHQMLREFVDYGGDNVEMLGIADLPKGYRLIAIGDVHIHKLMEHPEEPGCWLGYPGSTELKEAGEDGKKFWVECIVDNLNRNLTLVPHSIDTRPVLRVDLTHPDCQTEAIDNAIVTIKRWEEAQSQDGRKPILFISHLNTLPEVMHKFKVAFDPDQYILRFDPIFATTARKQHGLVDEAVKETTIAEILRNELKTDTHLYEVASKLINQDLDPNGVIEEYIAARLRDIEAAAANPDHRTPVGV